MEFIILDLDDTIYKEIDFVKSGFISIVENYAVDQNEQLLLLNLMINSFDSGENALKTLFDYLNINSYPIEAALRIYHSHLPNITLPSSSKKFFELAKRNCYKIGLISDGRSLTQRNKLKSLGIDLLFDKIIISEEFGSEKPSIKNFKVFEDEFPGYHFHYIGDNLDKDFEGPTKLGWKTYCLKDDGRNIHKQIKEIPANIHLIEDLNHFFNLNK
jgi:putative hydrolase of the HAD superfamily